MRSPDGRDFWSTGVYREIVPGERLVMTDSFADERGNVVPATHYGMSPDLPLEMEIEIRFEEKQGKTTLTLRHIGIPEGTMRELTEAGWNESFDKLAESLKIKTALTGIIAERGKQDIVVTRVFDAPRATVWKAWTDPDEVKKWWGPKDFTAPHVSIDLRVGGRYVYCMRGAGIDGVVRDFCNTGEHVAIIPGENIVTTMKFADQHGNPVPASYYGIPGEWPAEIMITVAFKDSGDGKTLLTLREAGVPDVMTGLAALGWNQSLDKLAASLRIKSDRTRIIAEPGKQEIVITRIFDAPRELVFKAYTDPKRIPQWWGPKRLTTIVKKMDVRPGGIWRFVQRDADGNEYAFRGVYHDILSPSLIVATFEFEGAPGHVSLETAVFEDIGGRTKMRSRSVFQTVDDRDEMLKEGMEEGVIETMDRFAELLENAKTRKRAA
jgi:uncharacterized protein YndB with AHSA1/START domain